MIPPQVVMLIAGLDIGGRHGGAERFGLELACSFARQNLAQVTLVAFWETRSFIENSWKEAVEEQGVKVIFCTPWRYKHDFSGFLRGVKKLEQQLPKFVDIMHSHFQLGSLAAIWLKLRRRVRFICRTAHITREWGDDWLAAFLRWGINGWIYPRFLDAEVGVSQAVCESLNRRSRRHRYGIFIPNAVPKVTPTSQRDIQERFPEEITIGFIGRLTPQKDPATLINAFSLVKQDIPKINLELAGDGPLLTGIQDLCVEWQLTSSVRFFGAVADAQSCLCNWQLLVLPSLYEGLPTVVLEALASGIPVIGSDIPGIRDLIQPGNNGWLFPAGDAHALADLIRQIVSDPDRLRSMADACRASVHCYDIDEITRQYSQMIYPLKPVLFQDGDLP